MPNGVNSTRNHWNVHHVLVHVYHRITMNYCWFWHITNHVQGHTDIIDLNTKTEKNRSQKWLYLILVLGTYLPYPSTKSPLYHNVCYGLNHVNPPIFLSFPPFYRFVSEQAIQKKHSSVIIFMYVCAYIYIWYIYMYDIYIYVYIYIDIYIYSVPIKTTNSSSFPPWKHLQSAKIFSQLSAFSQLAGGKFEASPADCDGKKGPMTVALGPVVSYGWFTHEKWWFSMVMWLFSRSEKHILVGGFNPPLWKMMEPVSWDDDIPNWMDSHKIHVPNHQPGSFLRKTLGAF